MVSPVIISRWKKHCFFSGHIRNCIQPEHHSVHTVYQHYSRFIYKRKLAAGSSRFFFDGSNPSFDESRLFSSCHGVDFQQEENP
jgi:hypothetical protein